MTPLRMMLLLMLLLTAVDDDGNGTGHGNDDHDQDFVEATTRNAATGNGMDMTTRYQL